MYCWAQAIGGCSQKTSREHLVSGGLWSGDQVDVFGFPWCKDVTKRIGLASLTGRVLCTHHNSRLSPIDQAGIDAFVAIRDADELCDRRNRQRPHRKWRVRRFDLSGMDLERWFLKSTINLALSQKSALTWAATGRPLEDVPLEVVEVAFGARAFAKPRGLYCVGRVGQTVVATEGISFAPLIQDGNSMVGGMFGFRGMNFLVYFGDAELPVHLDLPGSTSSGWEAGQPLYRLRRQRWKIGRHLSHFIELAWNEPPNIRLQPTAAGENLSRRG